jgi:hypothetical protein
LVRPAGAIELGVTIEGPRVTVRAEVGLERQAREAAAEAPKHLAEIEADLDGLPRVQHVEVRLVKHAEDIADAAPPGRGAPEWAVGTAYPDAGVVVVAARGRGGELLDMDRTLSHELAHMALDKTFGENPVPRWLTEGFAYLHSSDFSLARAATLTGAVIGRKLVPLWQLEHAFPAREDEAALAYAESYDFVAWAASHDPWGYRRFLAVLSTGVTLDEASRQSFGRRWVDIQDEWLASLRDRYLWTFVGAGAALLWVFGAVLLVLGWWRRRKQARATLRRWELEEAMEDAPPHDLMN